MKYEQVVKHYGTQLAVAAALKINQSSVANWKSRGRIPSLQQLRLQKLTDGKLRADKEAANP